MTQQEIYNALWEAFERHTRKMTPEQMAEFDGLVDLASRKLAENDSKTSELCGFNMSPLGHQLLCNREKGHAGAHYYQTHCWTR